MIWVGGEHFEKMSCKPKWTKIVNVGKYGLDEACLEIRSYVCKKMNV